MTLLLGGVGALCGILIIGFIQIVGRLDRLVNVVGRMTEAIEELVKGRQ